MATQTMGENTGIKIRNKGVLLFGILLFVIGLALTLYEKVETYYVPFYGNVSVSRGYPYQGAGLGLIFVGAAFIALGFLYPQKTTPQPQPQQTEKTGLQDQGFLRKCVKCGTPIPLASEECPSCGASQKTE
jgi:uncharacterized membrane protein